jgi:LysM repeat protein
MITTGQLAVGTTAVAVAGSSVGIFTLTLHNGSASNNIRLGSETVTASTGLELHSQAYVTIQMMAGDTLYAISSSGTHDISWMKVS